MWICKEAQTLSHKQICRQVGWQEIVKDEVMAMVDWEGVKEEKLQSFNNDMAIGNIVRFWGWLLINM